MRYGLRRLLVAVIVHQVAVGIMAEIKPLMDASPNTTTRSRSNFVLQDPVCRSTSGRAVIRVAAMLSRAFSLRLAQHPETHSALQVAVAWRDLLFR